MTRSQRRIERARTLTAVLALAWGAAACGGDDGVAFEAEPDPRLVEFHPSLNVDLSQMTETASGLFFQDLVVGTGAAAAAGDTIIVAYRGWLPNGERFDSSEGFALVLGIGFVIPGWDEGLVGMQVRGIRKLVIPPTLAYGDRGSGPIPPNAVIVFDVELISIENSPPVG